MPATVAAGLGAAAPVAYLVCATLMGFIALCFAAAGSRVSLTGGLYAYIEVAFGGYAGYLGGFLYWSTACLSVASVATAFAGSVGVFWPALMHADAARDAPRPAVRGSRRRQYPGHQAGHPARGDDHGGQAAFRCSCWCSWASGR